MALSNPSQEESDQTDINITPFVDVVLVLLVIFMVTTPALINEQLKVNLPKTKTSDLSAPGATVGLAISREGQIFMNGELLDKLQLIQKLKDIQVQNPQTHFLISADSESRHGALVEVIDLLKMHELHQFALQVERISNAAVP